MFKWVNGLLDRMCAVAGAIIFLQAPLFMRQYMQQLSGHAEELRLQVLSMQKAAALTGKTLEQYINKFLESGDIDYVHQGDIMLALVGRWAQFSDALNDLQNSTVLSRPFMFITHLNWDIVKSTWENYSFGLPLNVEGAVYAIVGLAIGFVIYSIIRRLGILLCGRLFFRKPKQNVAQAKAIR